MSNALLAIAMSDAAQGIKDGMTTEEMLLACMRQSQHFFMSTDDDIRMRGAIGAVMKHVGPDSEEYEKIEESLRHLKMASAFLQACMAGLSVDLPEGADKPPPFALMKLWHQSKEGK